MKYFKVLLPALCALLILSTPALCAIPVVPIDRIVAVVNNDVITAEDLQTQIKIVITQLNQRNIQIPDQETLEKQVLERIIINRLMLQAARQENISVDDTQLNKALDRIAEQNQMSLAQFQKELEKQGISFAKFREDIREQIMIARVRESAVENRISVTNSEIDNLLTTQAAKPNSAGEFNVSHILIQTPENSSPEALKKLQARAEEAWKKLQTGESFAQVSAKYSNAPNALEGGALGWKTPDQLPSLFTEAIQKLAPGQITGILRSPNGFHILKLHELRGTTAPTLVEQTQARHILIKVNDAVSETQALRTAENIQTRLENGEDFAKLAALYSEDPSASKGGDLGWINPMDTVPAFEKAMNALAIKQISAPVRTPFGFHLIQVLARRTQDLTSETRRAAARQEIRARKSDEAYQDWLSDLRDKAYIEYRKADQ